MCESYLLFVRVSFMTTSESGAVIFVYTAQFTLKIVNNILISSSRSFPLVKPIKSANVCAIKSCELGERKSRFGAASTIVFLARVASYCHSLV